MVNKLEIAMVKAIMNSLGDTVLRRNTRRKAGGGEDQGRQGREESFTSDAGGHEADDSASSGKKKSKAKDKIGAVSAEQAFAALGRATRAPFIADESEIAAGDDPTVKVDSEDSDCEIVMEELPPQAFKSGVRVGHRGWVTGSDAEEDQGDSGEEGERTDSRASKGSRAAIKPKSKKTPSGADARRRPGPKAKKGRQKDEFDLDWSGDEHEGDGGGGAATDDSAGGKVGKGKPAKVSASKKVDAKGKSNNGGKTEPPNSVAPAGNAGKGGADAGKRLGRRDHGGGSTGKAKTKGKDSNGSSSASAASGGEVAGASAQRVHALVLDARPSRPELKTERRAAVRQRQAELRKEAGQMKQLQLEQESQQRAAFDAWTEGIRQANPFIPGEGQRVIWSRESANRALAGLSITYERWQPASEQQKQAFYEAAVAWLEENKPKTKFAEGKYRVVVGERARVEDDQKPPEVKGSGSAAKADSSEPAAPPKDKGDDREGSQGGGGSNSETERRREFKDQGGKRNRSERSSERESEESDEEDEFADERDEEDEDASDRDDEDEDGDEEEDSNEEEEEDDDADEEEEEDKAGDGAPARKKANTSDETRQHRSTRVERRRADQEESRESRQQRQEGLGKRQSVTPKALGRAKQAELDRHKRLTRKRERAKRDVRDLIEASLLQQKRQKGGKRLTADEQQLAAFAKTLSPTKLLGAGFRLAADGGAEVMPEEDEDALEELMQETGCDRERAQEALDLSCDWTGSGRPSSLKAAKWLMAQRDEDGDEEEDEEDYESEEEVKVVSHRSPGGTVTAPPGGQATGGTGRPKAAGGKESVRGDRRVGDDADGEKAKSPKTNRKSVPKSTSHERDGRDRRRSATRSSSEDEGDSSSGGSLSESLGSESGSDSDRGDSSDSDARASMGKAAEKRDARGKAIPSSRGSRSSEVKKEARYVRQLQLQLKIDAGWAQEIFRECSKQGTTSYDGLLRFFYRREVACAKGTQKETAKPLGVAEQPMSESGKAGALHVNMPTFQLPEWGPGQPPNGGVHFTTLQKMLEAYEKYDKQTNFNTQVTFKSMVKAVMKPNFESKCKLPETVWLPPVEDDWRRVLDGEPERGGWSDMRFLKRIRRELRPKGRTGYEIAFEEMTLRHRGNDEQLTVNLDLWGTKWFSEGERSGRGGQIFACAQDEGLLQESCRGSASFSPVAGGENVYQLQGLVWGVMSQVGQKLGSAC